MKYILEIRNLSHAYDQATSTIKDLNFALKKGEIVSILGPSGIGKTTLLRIVAGLEDVVDGEIKIRPMMYLALSYDHRIIDGKESVSFLKMIKENLEDPRRLFLDI